MLHVVTYRQYAGLNEITGEMTYKLPVFRSAQANGQFSPSAFDGDPVKALDTIRAAMEEKGWNCRVTTASGRGLVRNLRCFKVSDSKIKLPSA